MRESKHRPKFTGPKTPCQKKRAFAAFCESLEVRQLFAFGVTTSGSTFVVDTGGGVVFSVLNNSASTSSTIHRGDLSSFKFNSTEFASPYSVSQRYSHFEQGLSSLANISYTVDPSATPQWIVITGDDSDAVTGGTGTGVIQYYIAKRNDPIIYMATYAPVMRVSSTRFITYVDSTKFPYVNASSNNSGNTGAIESGDVFGYADGTTTSKYYGETRNIDHLYHGASGPAAGAFMFIGNRESGAGGPFWKDIDFQSNEIYTMPYSGHSLTDTYRPGLSGPFALELTGGTPPTVMPDYSFIDAIGLQGWVSPSARGTLSGQATGVAAGHVVTVGLSNSAAQYWTNPDPSGNYTISGIKPGTYTETIYDEELAVGVRTVTISAGVTTRANITATAIYGRGGISGANFNVLTAFNSSVAPIWRIGKWDGTPREFLNGDQITIMHPQDSRLSPWATDSGGMTNFTIGSSIDSQWPLAEWKSQVGSAPYVDTKNRITFNLTSTQRSQGLTLRIGVTRTDSERPGVSANGGTTQYGAIISQPDARGVSLGNWRGNNGVYYYSFSANSLIAGTNTFDIYSIAGSNFTGYFSGYHIYDAVDLVPTSSLYPAAVTSLTVTPGTGTNVTTNAARNFFAVAKDSGNNVVSANVTWTASRGTINDAGEYVAPATTGTDTVTATYGSVTSTITLNIVGTAPTIATAASAGPNPTYNKTTTLSVLGADDGGEAALTYTWAVVGTQPGTVTFGAANGSNSAKSLVASFSAYGTYSLQVTITDASGNSTISYVNVSALNEKAWYKFDQPNGTGLTDYSGNTDFGTVFGTFSTVPGVNSGALNFKNGAATLPTGIVAGLTDFTIATWVKADTLANWARIFDFGTSTTSNMYLTARSGATGNPIQFGITTSGAAGEQKVTGPALTAGIWTHIAVSLSGTTLTLYVNGAAVGTTTGVTLTPSSLGTTTLNFLGDSQYSADPTFLGSIDDFRIYPRALTTGEVSTLADRPTVATAAAASPSPVTGTTTTLSVLGADALNGEASLTYTWSLVGQDYAGPVYFSANATNAAKTTTATFTAAGSYTFLVTIANALGNSITSTVTVTVNQTVTSVAVTPTPVTVVSRATQQFVATAYDQFGDALTAQPAFTWARTSGTGSIDSTGLYTAPAAAGSAVISATTSAKVGTASITITNAAPTVGTAASATPNPVTGTSTDVDVLGADDGGENNLIYTWTYAGPAPVAFSANGNYWAKDATAYFMKAGTYTLTVTINDGALSTTSSTSVTVNSTLWSMGVAPTPVALKPGQTQQFAATAYDQFGEVMTTPALTWSVTGVGSVNTSGLYTASAAGAASVFATSGAISGSASVTVGSAAPTVATAAAVSTSTVTGSTVGVSVLGADDGGEAALSYFWSVVSGPSSVSFSSNNSNAAKNATASFQAAGSYVLGVKITDANGNSVTSSVGVTVAQTATTLKITPGSASVGTGTSKQFAASATDQFGAVITNPVASWSVSSGAGSITTGGLFTAPAAAGKSVVRAVLGALSATSAVTVFSWAPYNLTVKSTSSNTLSVSFRDSTTIETGFQLQVGIRQSNGTISWTTTYALSAMAGSGGTVTYAIPQTFTTGTWYFRVRATNASGSSNWSNTVLKAV